MRWAKCSLLSQSHMQVWSLSNYGSLLPRETLTECCDFSCKVWDSMLHHTKILALLTNWEEYCRCVLGHTLLTFGYQNTTYYDIAISAKALTLTDIILNEIKIKTY